MASEHPLLHPKLRNFSIFLSFEDLISTNEKAINFLEEVGLIPSRTSTPPECCGLPMKPENNKERKLKWMWRCASLSLKKKNTKTCRRSKNPTIGTFFDGNNSFLQIREVLAIIISFVINIKLPDVYSHIIAWRRQNHNYHDLKISTLGDYYSYCRGVAKIQTLSSHVGFDLGGEGETVEIDEKFLLYYRRNCLEKEYKNDYGSQIMQFLLDIKKVYPGIVSGKKQSRLKSKLTCVPKVELDDAIDMMPAAKKLRCETTDDDSKSSN